MDNHKKIAVECGIINGLSIHSNTELIESWFYKALDLTAKQAFEAARSKIKNEEFDLGLDDLDSYSILKYKTFEDYLKDLKDGNN